MKISSCKSLLAGIGLALVSTTGHAWQSKDGSLVVHGFLEHANYTRFNGVGVAKARTRAQAEWVKEVGSVGPFRDVTLAGTLRGSYDSVYDISSEFGDDSGGAVTMANYSGAGVAWGGGLGLDGGVVGGATNPNTGLVHLGADLHGPGRGGPPGGVDMAYPTRPCDTDSRGCIDGYLDFNHRELAAPEFNDRADVIREAYVDATLPLANGDEIAFRVGRQQVVWGRTDLFRVLDVVNPVDFSQQNIYEELEDARIPMGIFNMEYHAGAVGSFEDLNFQFLWKFEEFRPHNLGQGGSPYAILQAGNFFRAMKLCWDLGCTVGNFAFGNTATDFGPHQIGIRRADMPGWKLSETDVGARLEGVYKGIGFSLNALYYNSYLPTLRGGIASDNPFTGGVENTVYPYALAFDIAFPRILLLGGSADFYVDKIKSAFRVELAWTTGEEFVNTARPRLFSESDVIRYVIGWDRPTFIKFLNKKRAFLISAQLFGQHILDHELIHRPLGDIGIPDWKENWVGTLLIQGFYKNDTVQPRVIMAYDYRAQAGTIAPQVDWLISNNWRLITGFNIKVGTGARHFDDNRTSCPYAPAMPPPTGCGAAPTASLGMFGSEPLGRFRSGPIGMAQAEDEFQIALRYRF